MTIIRSFLALVRADSDVDGRILFDCVTAGHFVFLDTGLFHHADVLQITKVFVVVLERQVNEPSRRAT